MPLSKLFIVYATFTNIINFKINIFVTTFGKQCFLKNTHPPPLKKKIRWPPQLEIAGEVPDLNIKGEAPIMS